MFLTAFLTNATFIYISFFFFWLFEGGLDLLITSMKKRNTTLFFLRRTFSSLNEMEQHFLPTKDLENTRALKPRRSGRS